MIKLIRFFILLITIFSVFNFTIGNSSCFNNQNLSTPKYLIMVDLYSYTLSVIDTNTKEIVKSYPVAIGKKETPSPIGTWQVKSKALMDGPFGGYWLGLNAPWDTFGIHGTSNPNSICKMASNGCIRMYNYDIAELFSLIEYDTSVIIHGGPNWLFSPYSRVIMPNQKGSDIYYVQRILNAKGYFNYPADGIFGYTLELAVLKYKEEHDLIGGPEIDEAFLKSIGCEKFE